MRFLLLLSLGLLLLPGCDQALDTGLAGRAAAAPVDGPPSRTFAVTPHGTFDVGFVLSGNPDDYLTVEMLDGQGGVLATFQESGGGDKERPDAPYKVHVSGPVTQSWDMMVCPVDSIDEAPPPSDSRCDTMARTNASQSQFMGQASDRITSVHHKPGHTYYDYQHTDDVGARFYVPSSLPAPGAPAPKSGWSQIPNVNYVLMSPVDALGEYAVRGVRLTWPATSHLQILCVSQNGSNASCGGSSNGGGGGNGTGDGDVQP